MKIIKRILFTLAITIPVFGLFFFSSTKVEAANCTTKGAFEITKVVAEQSVNGVPKVMPGENIQVTVKNNCDTNNIRYNIFVYPAKLTPGEGEEEVANLSNYQKVTGLVLTPLKDHMSSITIYGTDIGDTAVDYKIRVVGWRLDASGKSDLYIPGAQERDLIIATKGIVISGDTSVVQNETKQYIVKFFNHPVETFSIYVDGTGASNLKVKDISIPNDDFTYSSFSWDTAGTEVGSHQIIVKLNTGESQAYTVAVTAPPTNDSNGSPSGTTAGFSLSKLNTFNIKTLINSCKGRADLDGIMCMVETVINWLLDIGAVISLIMILYASAIYLTSYGDESKAELAKKTLIWSVIGVAVIGAAKAIMTIINNYLIK